MDASQGVQAQSISVFHIAKERGLKIIPVLNKVRKRAITCSGRFDTAKQIDLPAAQPDRIAAQIHSTFGIDPKEILHISAKTGKGVEDVLTAIINRIPPPSGLESAPLKAFLFDSLFVLLAPL